MAKKHKSNPAWLHQHVTDHYVREARKRGYRSRAAFKLLEIDAKDKLLKRGMRVIDLGAAPGSWSQVVREKIGGGGQIVAVDVLPIAPLPGVVVIQGDVEDSSVLSALEQALAGQRADLVLSDLAPNLSGIASVDQAKSLHLAELARDFANQWLRRGGDFLVKVFQGESSAGYERSLKNLFTDVVVRKPPASRGESRELYLLAKGRLASGL